ncbi:MAG: hypothetical protein DRR16_22790 [Candidatus Parabeggiatoa sp. nov. 3]|nr:MAG: hypothetical protein DRR00_28985 [Gammaproteobacteria bacterium]RKZ68491.1 MAG: hypothetical protein DRQ99_03725 [Gammaproteobacteria bacterium]RKZ81036.1 MAG: hypothetical protein DRR16_22790 [Gammaproteobacteria bacterium]
MKINSVNMMRKIRDELDQQIQEMTWEEENKFIKENLTSFKFLTDRKKSPNNALYPTTLRYATYT